MAFQDGAYRSVIRSCYESVLNDDVTLKPGDFAIIAAQSNSQPFVAMILHLYICPILGKKSLLQQPATKC